MIRYVQGRDWICNMQFVPGWEIQHYDSRRQLLQVHDLRNGYVQEYTGSNSMLGLHLVLAWCFKLVGHSRYQHHGNQWLPLQKRSHWKWSRIEPSLL